VPGGERRARRRVRTPNRLTLPLTASAGALLILVAGIVSLTGGKGDAKSNGPSVSSAMGLPAPRAAHGAASATVAPTVPRPVSSPAPVSGCVSGQRLAAGATNQTISSGGVGRSYLLAVPAPAKGVTALPVIVNFHGFNESALTQENYTHLAEDGTKAGYIVVTPLGVHNRWNFVRRAAVGPDDVTFVSALLTDLSVRTCIDTSRVFATGMSDGADMAVTLGCALPARIAAVVAVAASVTPATCGPSPPSMLEIHGTADPVVPYGGGGGDRAAPFQGTTAQPVQSRLATYATRAGCTGTGTWQPSVTGTRLLRWSGCPGTIDVGLLAVTGGGHTWPGAAPRPTLGPTATTFSANEVILTFFGSHAKAAAAAAAAAPSTAPAAVPSTPPSAAWGSSAGSLTGTVAGN
jgi:polyhydroxybutyrate depolymerase